MAPSAKTLCICHNGAGGVGTLGYVVHRTAFVEQGCFGNEVQVDCVVPRYNVATELFSTTSRCIADGRGTFWETLK